MNDFPAIKFFIAFLVLLISVEASSENEGLSVEQLLSQVVVANRYYSYDALVTYEANGSLSTLRLSHAVDYSDDYNSVSERLEFLDGASRHVLREQKLKSCDNGKTRWGLWPSNFDVEDLKRFYRIAVLGEERVAERQTLVIDFVPKDEFRYGYRFNVDIETGLLLRSLIVNKGDILERTQFVSLVLNDNTQLNPRDKNIASWRVPEVDPCHTEQFQSAWYVSWLPEGFTSAGNRITAQGEQVLMFTDGMVSISVFVTSGSYSNAPKITAHRGATVAVISPLPFDTANSVAVVGEIPAVTARQIAVSVKSR